MRHVLLLAALIAPGVSSAQIGLGVAVQSDPAIYIPIELTPVFRLEPFFAWSEEEFAFGGGFVDVETRQVGAGGFMRAAQHERLQAYLGGRLSFVEIEAFGSEVDGFELEPAIGLEFFVTPRVSVAGEAFLFIQDLDGDGGEQDAKGTGNRLLVRFML